MEAAVKTFFSSPHFAVAGASQDPQKFGYKVLAWYSAHGLPVTPISPRTPQIAVHSQTYETVPSASGLASPSQTSLSIITPPPVTMQILKEAKEAGIPAVWLQPGTFDAQVLEFAKREFKGAAVGGDGGNGGGGWCVLVDGEDGLRAAGRKGKL